MTSIQLALTRDWNRQPHLVPCAILVGLCMAALGPFGTAAANIGSRMVYWPPLLLGSWAVTALFVPRLKKLAPEGGVLWNTVISGAGILLFSIPMTLVAARWSQAVFERHFAGAALFGLYRNVVIFATLVVLLEVYRTLSRPSRQQTARPEPKPLVSALRPQLRSASVIALHAQDHYVEVYTSAGSQLVHARLCDLIATLPSSRGARVHRSWWVAYEEVARVIRAKGRTKLVLHGGLTVPVGRSFLPALRSANIAVAS